MDNLDYNKSVFIFNQNMKKMKTFQLNEDDYLSSYIDLFKNIVSDSLINIRNLDYVYDCPSTFVKSPQGTGKTTLMMQLAHISLYGANIYNVIVIPNLSNGIHVKEKGGYFVAGTNAVKDKIADNFKYNVDALVKNGIIITTPESLEKVIKTLVEYKVKYIVHIDEAHHETSTCAFREMFSKVKEISKKGLCIHLFSYTATPGALLHYAEFDNVFFFKKKGDILDFPLIAHVLSKKNFTTKSKIKLIDKYLEKLEGEEKLLTYLSNVKEHEEILKALDGKYGVYNIVLTEEEDSANAERFIKNADGKMLHLSSKTKKDETIKDLMSTGEIPSNCKLVLITSIGSCGIEFFEDNASVLVFCNRTAFNFLNESQFTRRNRLKIKRLILALPDVRAKWDILPYEDYRYYERKKAYSKLQKMCTTYNDLTGMDNSIIKDTLLVGVNAKSKDIHKIESNFELLDRATNAEGDLSDGELGWYFKALKIDEDGEMIINDAIVENIVWNSYCWNMLKNPVKFVEIFMRECEHFIFTKEPKIIFDDKFDNDGDKIEKTEEDKKIEKEKNKNDKKDALEKLSNYSKIDVIRAVSNNLLIDESKTNREIYETIKILETSDKSKYNILYNALTNLTEDSYKEHIYNLYVERRSNKDIVNVYKKYLGMEQKQILVNNAINMYLTKDLVAKNHNIRIIDKKLEESIFQFVVLTCKYFINENGIVYKDKKIRISENSKNFKEFYNYLCDNNYYKSTVNKTKLKEETDEERENRQKKEFADRLESLLELMAMIFTYKNGNVISSLKSI